MNVEATMSDMKHQDLFNNNHMGSLVEETTAAAKSMRDAFTSPRPMSSSSSSSLSMYLFDPSLLVKIRPESFRFQYDKFDVILGSKTTIDLGDNLIFRPLRRDDFSRGYMSLLSQLTEVGQVNAEQFERRFDQMRAAPNTYYICVVEDTSKSKLVATLTLVYEQKFIRGTSARGRVEDLVVDADYRGKKLSKLLLDVVCQLAKQLGCYKISLECKDHLKKHYEQFGFAAEPGQNHLCQRFI